MQDYKLNVSRVVDKWCKQHISDITKNVQDRKVLIVRNA